MSRESELQAEIDAKTKDFEKIKNEKEAAEEKMRIHVQNLDLVDKIDYIQKTIKMTGEDYFKKNGWSFIIGKNEKNDDTYVQFKNEWLITFPNDPELFNKVFDALFETLEKKKNALKEDKDIQW